MTVLLYLALLAVALPLGAGFLGALHPLADSFAHFRLHLSAALLVLALLALIRGERASRRLGAAAVVAAGAAMVSVAPYYLRLFDATSASAAPVSTPVRLLQMNLLHSAEPAPTLQRIAEADADILMLQEVSTRWKPIIESLEGYPHKEFCESSGRVGGLAILSRHPFSGAALCRPDERMLVRRIDLHGRPLTLVSQHLAWPYPSGQWDDLAALEPLLEALPAPILVTGDFNAVTWSASVRRYARATGTQPLPGFGPTWPSRGLAARWLAAVGLPIDNVLVSPEVLVEEARALAPTASDHLPLLVDFRLDEADVPGA